MLLFNILYRNLSPKLLFFQKSSQNISSGGGRPPYPGESGNFQQVIVEQPNLPPPYTQSPSQLFPEKWPSNLVAALVPANWLADNFNFQFGQSDNDEYDYEYEYEEYEYSDYEYTNYYGEDYNGDYGANN